ncbi:MAG: aspartate aminotransferase family protein [Armatimonadota bacterium]
MRATCSASSSSTPSSTDDLAALIVEPYQGAAGFIFPPDGYLTRLEAWARDKDVIFILDEVQSSFGRTGKFFALEWEGLRPNLLCLGKGIGSGVPTAALMAESRIMDSLGWGEMSSTTGGNPLSCAAALAVLDIMEHENLVEKARRVGQYMLRRFQGMAEKYEMLGDARGKGLVMGLEFVEDKQSLAPAPELTRDIVRSMCEHGVVCGCLGWHGNVIRVAPPLVITDEHAEQVCDTFDAVLSQHR